MKTGLDWHLLAQAGIFLAALLLGWLAGKLVQSGLNRVVSRQVESGAGQKPGRGVVSGRGRRRAGSPTSRRARPTCAWCLPAERAGAGTTAPPRP